MAINWDTFDEKDDSGDQEQKNKEGQCTLRYGDIDVQIDLTKDDAPQTLKEAFLRFADKFETNPKADVRFRALSKNLESEMPLQAGILYVASVHAEEKGN